MAQALTSQKLRNGCDSQNIHKPLFDRIIFSSCQGLSQHPDVAWRQLRHKIKSTMQGLQSLLRLWERLQVELHGQYSLARLDALIKYQARHISRLRALALAVLGPLPPLLLLIAVDAQPLVPSSEGLYKQTYAFWLRASLIGWAVAFTLIYQISFVVPALPMSTIRLCVYSTISGIHACAAGAVLDRILGFPVPFAVEFESGPFLLIFSTLLWLSWKDTIRADPLARQDLIRYLKVVAIQIILFHVYTAFIVAFNQLQGLHQTLFSALLPLIKLFFKNWIRGGVFHLEDLSPTVVVFFVDVFHALFLSVTMQQASANGANVVVIIVDIIQTCIAYYELSQIVDRIHVLANQDEWYTSSPPRLRGSKTDVGTTVSIIDYAAHTFRTATSVRTNPWIALPRHSRGSVVPSAVFVPQRQIRPQETPASGASPTVDGLRAQLQPDVPRSQHQHKRRQPIQQSPHVGAAKNVLKLLHMLEFYVLVEYVEAMISVSYALYILVLSYLPSHQYYTQLSRLSSSQLRITALYVSIFAGAEVLSLVVFCVVVDRKVKNFSTLRLLAFVLESNGKLIYAVTVGWVFMIVQLSLDHFGSDYTFQFHWMK